MRRKRRRRPTDEGAAAGGRQAAHGETAADGGWESFFTYDEAGALQFPVNAAIPGEEDAFTYPWGEYDALPEGSQESGPDPAGTPMSEEEREAQIQKALEGLSPELREAAEKAMREAQARQSAGGSQEAGELPSDWYDFSNQTEPGGRLEFMSSETAVILELSEYCVNANTAFTVMPVSSAVLPEEFIKGGFLLTGTDREVPVTLDDYAVVTFVTTEDPGEDVVIKGLGRDGVLEYSPAEVVSLGGTFRITGAVTHFSTVGYGSAALSGQAAAAIEKLDKSLAEQAAQQEKARLSEKWAREYEARSHVRTITFDEILFTTTVRGDPCQLHLRAKLVEQPDKIDAASGALDASFAGKIWLKAYFLNPGAGYAQLYYLCNNATLEHPMLWDASGEGTSTLEANFRMTTIAGSTGVVYGIGEYNFSGRSYTMRSIWEVDENKGTVKVIFSSLEGFTEKTFVTGKLREVTKRQAGKKLKWFLD